MEENKKRCFGSAPGKEFYAEYHDTDKSNSWNSSNAELTIATCSTDSISPQFKRDP